MDRLNGQCAKYAYLFMRYEEGVMNMRSIFLLIAIMLSSFVALYAPSTAKETMNWTLYAHNFPASFSYRGPVSHQVALTFDDGPDLRYTPQILTILRHEHVKATFFILGTQAIRYPSVLRRIVQEGHSIGNHSFDHANLFRVSSPDIVREILFTDRAIRRITGIHTPWFRAPYGNINTTILNQLHQMGYWAVNWSVDSTDWRSLSSMQVQHKILAHVHPGAIILQHCSAFPPENLSGTVAALPAIIRALRHQGYDLVTIPDLLAPHRSTVR